MGWGNGAEHTPQYARLGHPARTRRDGELRGGTQTAILRSVYGVGHTDHPSPRQARKRGTPPERTPRLLHRASA
eukprot:8206975-Pyramimonas_sp.AAC.1